MSTDMTWPDVVDDVVFLGFVLVICATVVAIAWIRRRR